MLLWGENCAEWLAGYWGAVIAGVIVVPIDYRSSADFAGKCGGHRRRQTRLYRRRRRWSRGPAALCSGLALGAFDEFDWAADGPLPRRAITRDDVAQIVFTSGRHRRAEGRRRAPQEPARQPRAGGKGGSQVQALRAAVPAAAIPQPAAPQPSVRPVDGHQHPSARRRHRRLHAQLQPARHRPPGEGVARIGHRLRAEDPGRAARARECASIRRRPTRRRGCRFPRGGGATGPSIVRSAASSGHSSSARRRSAPELEEFWKRLGFVVIQGYGLTETAPIVT